MGNGFEGKAVLNSSAMARNKKILIISYYWPPAGGPGVQRWLKMSWYLAELGCDITVLSIDPDHANFPHRDESLSDEVHPSIKVHRTKAFNPYGLLQRITGKKGASHASFSIPKTGRLKFKILAFFRSHLFIPDPRKGWNAHAYKRAAELMRETNFDHLITTSPPHSSQLIGRRLKREFGVHWIADFRDPWTEIFFYNDVGHSWISRRIDRAYEKSVMFESDMIFVVTYGMKTLFQNKLQGWNAPNVADKVKVLTNGYDERDFAQLRPKQESSTFRLVMTGTLSTLYNYEVVFDVLGELGAAGLEFAVDVYGRVPHDVQQHILTLCSRVAFHGDVSHAQINQIQVDSELLLLFLPDTPDYYLLLPGKLFEYLRAGTEILILGPNDGDAARVISQCAAGTSIEKAEKEKIKHFLKEAISDHQAGIRKRPVNASEIQVFSRAAVAKQVLEYLD